MLKRKYTFHIHEIQRATDDLEVLKRDLNVHDDYYGNMAPINRRDIVAKIQRFNEVIDRAMDQMRACDATLRKLGRETQDKFTEGFRAALRTEYANVLQDLNSLRIDS